MRPSLLLLAGLLAACASPNRPPRAPGGSRAERLPVIAVTEFENRSGFSGQWNLGTDMADLLVSELMATGDFRVVERQRLGGVLGELHLQNQPQFRDEGKVEPGRLINARYQIRGVITDFSQISSGGFWVSLRRFLFRSSAYTARVALTLTVVEVESGEILASVQSSGTARARSAYLAAEYKGVNFGGDSFRKTPLGAATVQAIRSGIRQLDRSVPRQRWEPLIAEVLGNGHLVLNGGTRRGFRSGDLYRVLGPVRVITDPASGDVLSRMPGPDLGVLRIREVRPDIAIAEVLSGAGFSRGNRLAPVPPPTP